LHTGVPADLIHFEGVMLEMNMGQVHKHTSLWYIFA